MPPGAVERTANRSPPGAARSFDDDVVAVLWVAGALAGDGSEGPGDRAPSPARVEVVDAARVVGDGEARGVEADRLAAAADDEHPGAGARAQVRDDGAPCVGEVVGRGGDPQRVQPARQRHEHVRGERNPRREQGRRCARRPGRSRPL
jgi:hypothetical protein